MVSLAFQAQEAVQVSVIEDGGFSIMARLLGQDAAVVKQAGISGITCKVFDLDSATPTTATVTPSISAGSNIYDTLQTDARWTRDSKGYNFRHDAAASICNVGDHTFLFEYLFDPSSGQDFWLRVRCYAVSVITS